MKQKFIICIIVLSVSAGCVNALSSPNDHISEELAVLIQSIDKDSTIISSQNIDQISCGDHVSPGTVSGDFNSDGYTDYAMLIYGPIKKTTKWGDKTLDLVDIWFVFFLGSGGGHFDRMTVDKWEGYIPAGVYLTKKEAGSRINVRESTKEIVLASPGVAQVFCEKSETVYFWKNGVLDSIPVSD